MNDQPSIAKNLIQMVIPASIGMLLTFLFQLVDTYFIGQLGVAELAAVSFTFPIYMILIGMFMGVASGSAATAGKAFGEQNRQKVGDLTGAALLFMFVCAAFICALAIVIVEPTFYALGASEHNLLLIKKYMVPLYWGFPFLVIALIANATLMAAGKMQLATKIMAVGGVLNLIFDYLLIFGVGPFPRLEIVGAALATVVSWISIALLFLFFLAKKNLLPASIGFLKNFRSHVHEILSVSGAAVIAQLLIPISIAFLTGLIAQIGEEAVAAFGIATRIESLALTLIVALSVVITPIAAREFGAHAQKNIDHIIAFSGRLTVYWSLVVFICLAFLSPILSTIFTDNEKAINHISHYFLLVGLSYPAHGLSLITMSLFNGVYKPKVSLKLTVMKSLLATIPLALAGSFWGISGIFAGVALANFLAAYYASRLLNNWLKSTASELTPASPLEDYRNDIRILLRVLRWKNVN